MTVLVTGGAGFIGAHVARHLLDAGREVVVLDDLSGGYAENVPAGATFVEGSVTIPSSSTSSSSEHRFTHVFHIAAYAAEGLSHFIRRFNYTNNVVGSINVINAAIRAETVERFVFTSSIAVYGAGPDADDRGAHARAGGSRTAIAKYAVELDLAAAQRDVRPRLHDLPPAQRLRRAAEHRRPYRNVIGIFMNQLHDRPADDGLRRRLADAGVHAHRRRRAGDRALDRRAGRARTRSSTSAPTRRTPCSSSRRPSRACSASRPEIEHLPARQEVVHAFSDHSKLHGVFGEQTAVSLEDGLRRMAEWVQEVGVRPPVRFDSVEILRNLPPSWAAGMAQSV